MSDRAGSRIDVLLLAAFAPELAALKPAFASHGAGSAGFQREETMSTAAATAGSMNGWIGSLAVQARTCGIGLSAAAAVSSLHIHETRPRAVLLLGTCGAYRGFAPQAGAELAIGDVIVSRRILLADWATIEGHAQFPPSTAEPISSDTRLSAGLERAGAAPADVANTLGITVKDDVASRIAENTAAHVEHLEAYGVAIASAASGVPFAAVLGVANPVGSAGREQWRKHNARASEAVARLVLSWLETMAAEGLAPRAS